MRNKKICGVGNGFWLGAELIAGLTINTVNDGSSDQHMISGTIQKRFARGMQVLATYTRSIMMESTSKLNPCLLYTSPSPRDGLLSRMPSSA